MFDFVGQHHSDFGDAAVEALEPALLRAYALLRNVQTLVGKPDIIGRIEIRLHDADAAVVAAERVERAFGYDAESWQETNANFLGIFAMQNMIVKFVIGGSLFALLGLYLFAVNRAEA